MTPQREELLELFEKYKHNADNGYVAAITDFAKKCFNELKKLGDNATYNDVRKYICAAYNVGSGRYAKLRNRDDFTAIKAELNGVSKLDKIINKQGLIKKESKPKNSEVPDKHTAFKAEVRSVMYNRLCKSKNAMNMANHLVNECSAFITYCAENFSKNKSHNEAYRCAIGILARWDYQNNPKRYKGYDMDSMFSVRLCAGRIIEKEDIVAISQLEDDIIANMK